MRYLLLITTLFLAQTASADTLTIAGQGYVIGSDTLSFSFQLDSVTGKVIPGSDTITITGDPNLTHFSVISDHFDVTWEDTVGDILFIGMDDYARLYGTWPEPGQTPYIVFDLTTNAQGTREVFVPEPSALSFLLAGTVLFLFGLCRKLLANGCRKLSINLSN